MSHCHKKYEHCRWHLTIKAYYDSFLSFIAFNYRTPCTFCLHWQSDVHLDHSEEVDFSSLVTTTNFTPQFIMLFCFGTVKMRPYDAKSINYTQQANETTSIREHGFIWNIHFLELKETRPFCYFQHIYLLTVPLLTMGPLVSYPDLPRPSKRYISNSQVGSGYEIQQLYALHVLCIKITTGSNIVRRP